MTDDPIPSYLKNAAPVPGSLPRLEPEDVSWNGLDGAGDFTELVATHGYEPEPLLRLVVRAIVAGHPTKTGANGAQREERALAALRGFRGRGRPEKSRRHYLMAKIVRAYSAEHLRRRAAGITPVDPELAPIIREHIGDNEPAIRDDNINPDALRRWVTREFRSNFDLWLKRVHDFDDALRLERRAALRRVLADLKIMGVNVDMSALELLPPL